MVDDNQIGNHHWFCFLLLSFPPLQGGEKKSTSKAHPTLSVGIFPGPQVVSLEKHPEEPSKI